MLQLNIYNIHAFNTVAYTSSLAHRTVTMFVVALHVYPGSSFLYLSIEVVAGHIHITASLGNRVVKTFFHLYQIN